jgi:hypothetical protein
MISQGTTSSGDGGSSDALAAQNKTLQRSMANLQEEVQQKESMLRENLNASAQLNEELKKSLEAEKIKAQQFKQVARQYKKQFEELQASGGQNQTSGATESSKEKDELKAKIAELNAKLVRPLQLPLFYY